MVGQFNQNLGVWLAPWQSAHAAPTEPVKGGRLNPGGLRESHLHDLVITKEAPNYRLE